MKINRKYNNIAVLYVFFALIISFVSCTPKDENDILFTGDEYENMMQYIDANPDYVSFSKIVVAGKMKDALSSYNNNGGTDYTLFLPTNEAVTKFIDQDERYSTLDDLLKDTEYCAEIVRYHLVNGRISSYEFPNGALANKTISNYYLTISYKEENDVVSFSVNDESLVITKDIKLSNGTIHTVDKMLTPVVFTSYEWLEKKSDFSIYTELLSKCGLSDTLNQFELDEMGRKVYNEYTIFAESNDLYAKNNIFSFADLVQAIDTSSTPAQDFTSSTNPVNKYARYHILEKSVFLDEFATDVYNTYGDFPIAVDLNNILKFNTGVKTFETIINNNDTTLINYLQIDINKSNIVTRSGAIHQLDHMLFPYLPGRKTVTFQFYEEPVINVLRSVEGDHNLLAEELEQIVLIGSKSLNFIKSSGSISGVSNGDYIRLSGNIDFSFTTPKILAGRYTLKLVMDRGVSNYASVQSLVDNQNVGVVLDLSKDSPGFKTFTMGTVDFINYSSHTVKINTIIPGTVLIDRIIFEPI